MIDTMFWPFAFKSAAEQHNRLSINKDGSNLTAILHDIAVEAIPVKTFHTLFCPVYVLDARAQSAGGPGPPKWEPRSCIGVYLGHSPFHAGIVALVFNPRTSRVSLQYHVVFDDTFLTVPYMEAGTEPPQWKDLLKFSSEKATDEDFDLAQDWMSTTDKMKDAVLMPEVGTRITDPFVVVTEAQPTNNPAGNNPSNGLTPPPTSHSPHKDEMRVSKGGNKRPAPEELSPSNAAASSKLKVPRIAPQDDALATNRGNDFGHLAPPASSPDNKMLMPQCVNLHESGLRRSPRLKELAEQKTKQQVKAHVTWAKKLPPLVTLFTLFSLVSNFRV
jgi:hypothetical protein